MPNSAAENRRRILDAQVGSVRKGKYRPPKGGTPKGNRAFARKDGEPAPPRQAR